MSDTKSKRRYRVVRIDQLQSGDIIKTTGRRVIGISPSHIYGCTIVFFEGTNVRGTHRNAVRVGIYR